MIRAKKSLGQNFLIDEELIEKYDLRVVKTIYVSNNHRQCYEKLTFLTQCNSLASVKISDGPNVFLLFG